MTQEAPAPARTGGPLAGTRVLEIASLGPGPFAAMLLSDMGADVLRVDRAEAVDAAGGGGALDLPPGAIPLYRGRGSVGIDLKHPDGVPAVLRLVAQADVLLEGFRPGVMEKLGLGPDVCCAHNPRLVYGRVSGYGQDGPLAHAPGHDLNYIALSGVLSMIGERDGPPVIPLSLIGDFGGAGMTLAFGVLAALLERSQSGRGQVVDCSMVESASQLAVLFHGMLRSGHWHNARGSNTVDGGAHFYNVYQTADGEWIAIAAVLPKFYAALLRALELDPAELPQQMDEAAWPQMKARFAAIFATRTRAEWDQRLLGPEHCYSPVLDPLTAPDHPQHQARNAFVQVDGITQPAPAPRLSRTPGSVKGAPQPPGGQTRQRLADWGFSATDLATLEASGAIRAAAAPDHPGGDSQ